MDISEPERNTKYSLVKNAKWVVGIFAVASFLNDFGSDMIFPLWPLYVTLVIGADMIILGLLDGLGETVASISQAVSGYLSDRWRKRKPFIWFGYLLGSASRVGYATSASWQSLVPFRVIDRVGKMRDAPRDAIVADVSADENRGTNFGFLRTMDHLGAVCGIITSILLFSLLGYRLIFLLASLPSLVGVVLIILIVKERKVDDSKRIYRGFSIQDMDANLILFLIISGIFALASFSYSFLMIYAVFQGVATLFVPVLYLIFNVVASLMSLPFGKLTDRIGRKPGLAIAYALFGTICIASFIPGSFLLVIILFIMYGLHRGAIEPIQRTFVSELAPEQYRTSTLGTFKMIVGVMALPASLIAGILWELFGYWATFSFSLSLTGLAMLLLCLVKERNPTS